MQEQHGDRAALFMQWKGMPWPVMVDSLNLLGVRAVPTTLLIDGAGTIRHLNPKQAELDEFLARDYPDETVDPPTFIAPDDATRLAVATLSGGDPDAAIAALAGRSSTHPDDAAAHFRLGVLLRARHDSERRWPDDFANAVAAWRAALEIEPGQYIWRRRIQQYGPRLDKPYPFYDWVATARGAIAEAGGRPVPLVAEPSGAEIARPGRQDADVDPADEHPDPDGKLPPDTTSLILVRSVAVPSTDKRAPAYRIYIEFEPNADRKGHWNNESGLSQVWIDAPEGWQPSATSLPIADPNRGERSVGTEPRHVEFEIKAVGGHGGLPEEPLLCTAFYFVCEEANGTCQFLRSEIEIDLR